MGPFVQAIFVVCSLDLLTCIYADNLTMSFKMDTEACRHYVDDTTIERHNAILLGKCIWRIPDEEAANSFDLPGLGHPGLR